MTHRVACIHGRDQLELGTADIMCQWLRSRCWLSEAWLSVRNPCHTLGMVEPISRSTLWAASNSIIPCYFSAVQETASPESIEISNSQLVTTRRKATAGTFLLICVRPVNHRTRLNNSSPGASSFGFWVDLLASGR